jgi:hypothetical protein
MLNDLEDLVKQINNKKDEVKNFKDKNNYEMAFSNEYHLFDLYLKSCALCFSKRDFLNNEDLEVWKEAKKFINEFVKKYAIYEEKWVLIVDGKIKEQDKDLANIIDKKIEYEKKE